MMRKEDQMWHKIVCHEVYSFFFYPLNLIVLCCVSCSVLFHIRIGSMFWSFRVTLTSQKSL